MFSRRRSPKYYEKYMRVSSDAASDATADPRPTRTFPEDGDRYWFVSAGGEVESRIFTGGRFDNALLATGNIYRSEADAMRAARQDAALARLRDIAHAINLRDISVISAGFGADHDSYGIGFDRRESCFSVGRSELVTGYPAFLTKAGAHEAIMLMGDQLYDLVGMPRPKRGLYASPRYIDPVAGSDAIDATHLAGLVICP